MPIKMFIFLKEDYNFSMFVSGPVNTQSILGSTKLVTLLAIISISEHMFGLNMVSHVCWLLAGVVTIQALPQTRSILPHLSFYSTSYYNQ